MKIIYLNGPSSSGKTTIAKALQDSFSEPYLHFGIDKMIGFMPEKINEYIINPYSGTSSSTKIDFSSKKRTSLQGIRGSR